METAQDYIKNKVGKSSFLRTVELTDLESVYTIMEDYASHREQIAVEETLREASDRAVLYSSQLAEEILSLAPQIIEKLNKGDK